ncbi:MAG TPA: threonine--tRNA ligase [Candidatus Marinimicrobia bacterium]|nr:threonine--tRNA ligase [Candidatus Neomarinimicrobiota bacterium]
MNTIKVTLKDGSVRELAADASAYDLALDISDGLARQSIAAEVNGKIVDLNRKIDDGAEVRIITVNMPEAHEILLHSTAHIMAQAVKRLYPDAKVTIGPALEERFYYDFDMPQALTEEDLPRIEAEMEKIIKENQLVSRSEMPRDAVKAFFKSINEDYKLEIIDEIPDEETVSVYSQGEFSDLCRGPHIPSTGKISAFKLLSVAGAYWRGNQQNKMLSRVYGTAWPDKKGLKKYLNRLEEAKKRDHRRLGRELDLFEINEQVGMGLVLWYPNGALLRRLIEDYWYKVHRQKGYELVVSPHVGKADLWETSGHLGFYKESMYAAMDVEGQDYFIKPMNCPFHIMIYKSHQHSYRDLPIRYAELGTVYRYELSGALHGLMRVRGFTQDDAHIICTPDQLNDEVEKLLGFSFDYLKTFGFTEFEVYLSTRPDEKFVGAPESWDIAQKSLKDSLVNMGIDFKVDEGGGAFYGPKIDIKIKDAIGRVWQCTTIQFDFNLPERFEMKYVDADGSFHRPYMIHRAIMGSLERFIGILIEDTAGRFPLWLAPVQVKVLPIADRHFEYSQEIALMLEEAGIRVQTDARQEKTGYKIREAELKKIPYMVIIGDKEAGEGSLSVRKQRLGDLGTMTPQTFLERLQTEIATKQKE